MMLNLKKSPRCVMCEANCSRILFEASSHVPECRSELSLHLFYSDSKKNGIRAACYISTLSSMILTVYFVSSIFSQLLSSSLSGVTQKLIMYGKKR